MKTAQYPGKRQVKLVDVPMPAPGPGYVLIDVKCCGVCGSDLHAYRGEWQQGEFAGGHEFAGVIAAVGPGVEGLSVGDRVCAECFSHCGRCSYCVTGTYNMCEHREYVGGKQPSGLGEFAAVSALSVYKLPDGMSFEAGALVEPLAVAYRAVALAGVGHRDTLAVLGSGTIGLMAVAAAHAAGVGTIIATAKYPVQTQLATDLGAHHVIASDQDAVQAVKQITDGLGADGVVDCVCSEATLPQALAAARRRGAVVLVGGHREPALFSIAPIILNELQVTGSCCYGVTGRGTDFEWSLKLIETGRAPVDKLVTHRFGLDEVATAYEVADDKSSGAVKVMVVQD